MNFFKSIDVEHLSPSDCRDYFKKTFSWIIGEGLFHIILCSFIIFLVYRDKIDLALLITFLEILFLITTSFVFSRKRYRQVFSRLRSIDCHWDPKKNRLAFIALFYAPFFYFPFLIFLYLTPPQALNGKLNRFPLFLKFILNTLPFFALFLFFIEFGLLKVPEKMNIYKVGSSFSYSFSGPSLFHIMQITENVDDILKLNNKNFSDDHNLLQESSKFCKVPSIHRLLVSLNLLDRSKDYIASLDLNAKILLLSHLIKSYENCAKDKIILLNWNPIWALNMNNRIEGALMFFVELLLEINLTKNLSHKLSSVLNDLSKNKDLNSAQIQKIQALSESHLFDKSQKIKNSFFLKYL